jgi:hypothetical protein
MTKMPQKTKEANRLAGQPQGIARGIGWSCFHHAFHLEMEGMTWLLTTGDRR